MKAASESSGKLPRRRPSAESSTARAPAPLEHTDTAASRLAVTHDRIKGLVRRTFNKQVLSELGGFAGLFALDAERYPEPVLVSVAAGLADKLQLGVSLGLHASVGADLVNHCVNDIAVQGATPLFFLDYIGAAQLDPDTVGQVISGLVDACRAAGCALLGGETAEVPNLYTRPAYELAGFLTGVVSRPRLLTGDRIAEGDILLGLPSNGLHCGGFPQARQLLFDNAGYRAEQYVNELGDKVGAALMRPHRSYLSPIRKLLQAEVVHGFAHITSGGLGGDLVRTLPRPLAVQLDLDAWETPPLFSHLRELGGLNREEMMATFNMGIGLAAFVPADLLGKARGVLTRMNERSVVMGRVVRRTRERVVFG